MDSEAHSAPTSDDPDAFCTINVQVIVSLPPAERVSANNAKNTFRVNGNEYPMSRFGSWVFRSQTDEASNLLCINEGGLATAITWAVYREYNNLVTAWLSDCGKNKFVFEVRKSDQKHILGEISEGKMATSLEGILRSMSNLSYCENVAIKLIKIIQDSDKKTQPCDSAETSMDSVLSDRLKMERLHQAEMIARHMKSKQFMWALPILKQCLVRENNDAFKLQLLIRTYICAAHLKNETELEECLPRLVMTMKLATIPPTEISLYLEEYRDLIELLLSNESVVRALEIGFAFQEVIAKIPGVSERLEARARNIQQLCKAIKSLLQVNPGVCLKVEARTYIKRVQDEIDAIKRETYCDTLMQSQCVYYSEFSLAEVRKFMDRRIAEVFNDASFEFKRLSSCWADFPFVITRLRQHPEVSKYLTDDEYMRTLRKISMRPSLLEKHLKEPKIAEAHEVLTSEFGLFDSIANGESANKEVAEEKTSNGTKTDAETKPVDKKAAAQREKELGNEAYKNLNFVKAHEHYDKALHYDPDDALLHCNKAAVFISQKNFEMAKRACIFALEVAKKDETRFTNKDKAKIIARLAKAEFLDGRRDVALLFYQQSLGIYQDPKVIEEMKNCQQSILNNASVP